MSDKAVITSRRQPRGPADVLERAEAERVGAKVEQVLPQGTLITTDHLQRQRVDEQEFRMKQLPDADAIMIGSYRITKDGSVPNVPEELRVPAHLANVWPHHLVQLAAPPTEEWIQEIRQHGVDVVGPISNYGLFVVGAPDVVDQLEPLDSVEWVTRFLPAYRLNDNLEGLTGEIRVSIGVYPPDDVATVTTEVDKLGGTIVREQLPKSDNSGEPTTLIVDIDAENRFTLARLPTVRWLEEVARGPNMEGEREVQIAAGNIDNAGAPLPGYQTWLTDVDLDGTGVIVAICDGGIDANSHNNSVGHPDLRGRQVAFVDYTHGASATDTIGHGTHVACIALGNASTGDVETPAPSFLWGQGMAPGARYVNQNGTLKQPWPPDYGEFTRDAITRGALVMNMSWDDGGKAGIGYTASARRFDELVRDPDDDKKVNSRSLTIVSSAGNSGTNPCTITPPKEAKNLIVVGASRSFRPTEVGAEDSRALYEESSCGPAKDGRLLPTVVAPGTVVSAALSATAPGAGLIANFPLYRFRSGTSMASAHVAGCCALLIEWWRGLHPGKTPSPALLKALLINGADDLSGGALGLLGGALTNVPNNQQGWGRVNLRNIVEQLPTFPLAKRGPSIIIDQKHPLTPAKTSHQLRVRPSDGTRQLRITLVWTDAPGLENANPALVNDLDLEVTELATSKIYKGNQFVNGNSASDGVREFDHLNNVECVYIQNPNGNYDVRVIGFALRGNARPPFNSTPWQDFALVIENAIAV